MARDQSLRDQYHLKRIPAGLTTESLAKYSSFLDMTEDERSVVLKTVADEEIELLLELETARAMYQHPLDRDDGTITEAKVARHPERYKWDL